MICLLIRKFLTIILKYSDFIFSGIHWSLTSFDYEKLRSESEYASWFLAHGFGANHFTIDTNKLLNYSSLNEVNDYIKKKGGFIGIEYNGRTIILNVHHIGIS